MHLDPPKLIGNSKEFFIYTTMKLSLKITALMPITASRVNKRNFWIDQF